MTAAGVLGIVGFGISLLALLLAVSVTRRLGQRDPLNVPRAWRRMLFIRPPIDDLHEVIPGGALTRNQRLAFVANPTKSGVSHLREQAMRACAIRYLPQPMWFYTTEEDPGAGQARRALEQGADVVVAVGGDGTVRAVSEALVDSGATLGIIPMGTGNLFARNLDIPLNDGPAALRTVIEGESQLVDVGWLDVTRHAESQREDGTHLFLVIAGAGIDAEMVGGADDRLKKRLGWFAYFFAAAAHMTGKRMQAEVTVDEAEPVSSHMRTVLMANVGRLPAGIQLIPEASAWDGQLDVATLDARGGLVGWSELFGTVVAQGAGIKEPWLLRMWKTSRIDHVRGGRVEVRFAQPQKVQIDGEALGRARKIVARVHPKAFSVRVPQGSVEKRDAEIAQVRRSGDKHDEAEVPAE
jgi:diacylglycerol kinase (ATP)